MRAFLPVPARPRFAALHPSCAGVLLGCASPGVKHLSTPRNTARVQERRSAGDLEKVFLLSKLTRSCGYHINNLIETDDLGCVQRGFEWAVPVGYFGFPLTTDIAVNLSRVAVLSVVGEWFDPLSRSEPR